MGNYFKSSPVLYKAKKQIAVAYITSVALATAISGFIYDEFPKSAPYDLSGEEVPGGVLISLLHQHHQHQIC